MLIVCPTRNQICQAMSFRMFRNTDPGKSEANKRMNEATGVVSLSLSLQLAKLSMFGACDPSWKQCDMTKFALGRDKKTPLLGKAPPLELRNFVYLGQVENITPKLSEE